MNQDRRKYTLAVLAILGTVLFWAGNFFVGEYAVREIDPISLTFLRWLFAAVPLLILAQWIEKPNWRAALRHWPRLVILSVFGLAGYNLFLYFSLEHTSGFNASLIAAFNPSLIVLAAAIFLREKLTIANIVGVILAFAGVLIVVSQGDWERLAKFEIGQGELLMFGAIAGWTIYTVIARRLSTEVPPITSTALQAVFSVIFMIPFVAVSGLTWPTTSMGTWSLAYIIVFPSVLAYLLYNYALKTIPPSQGAVYQNLMPVILAVLAFALGQSISAAQIIGGAFVLLGVVVSNANAFTRKHRKVEIDTGSITK